ncbi:MAG: hypothetical protein ACRDGA_02200 [Bacteroidota bacterium]
MPYTHEVYPQLKIAQVTASSDINLAESIRVMYDVARDSRFKPSYGLLLDLRLSTFTPTLLESYQLARTLRELRHSYKGPMAIVVSNTLHFGIARMIASFVEAEGLTLFAFQDFEEAKLWLDQHIPSLPLSAHSLK